MRTLACTVAAAALLLAAPVALAHQGNPNYRSVVKSVTPETSGIDARILNFDDAVLVHNTSGKDVVILDYKQQPYVELKADGTVSVNTNSEGVSESSPRMFSGPCSRRASPSNRTLAAAGVLAKRRRTSGPPLRSSHSPTIRYRGLGTQGMDPRYHGPGAS